MKLVTPSGLVERLKINGSLARAACKLMGALAEQCGTHHTSHSPLPLLVGTSWQGWHRTRLATHNLPLAD